MGNIFDPDFVEGIVHWEFTDRIVWMEGEIYLRPQLEIIDNGYLSGVQGYFIVNIFRGMGSLIVPISCSSVHRNSPGPAGFMKTKRVFLTRVRKIVHRPNCIYVLQIVQPE